MSVSMILGLLALAVGYAAFVGRVGFGLRQSLRSQPVGTQPNVPVTVIVAAHNESSTIVDCLRSILANDYPARLTEVLVVDDGSTDGTAQLAEDVFAGEDRDRKLSVIRISGQAPAGKQAALQAGLKVSSGAIVLTTDADCTVADRWITSMIEQFSDDTGFVAGPVRYVNDSTFLRGIEALEFISLVGFGAGSIGIGYPTICNSANAAFRKELSDEYRVQYPGMATAQDELLMQFVHRKTNFDVRFCPRPEALVATRGADSLSDFFRQRARWASIVAHFPDFRLTVAPALIFVFFVALAVVFVAGFQWLPMFGAVAASMLIKTSADLSVVTPTCRHFGCAHLLKYVAPAELLHIPYVLIAAPFGLIRPPRWKERTNRLAATTARPRYSPVVVADDS